MTQLVSGDDKLVMGRALDLIPNDLIKGLVMTSGQLALCGFATPKTRFGMQRRTYRLQPSLCLQHRGSLSIFAAM
jgi:hypothetical protein